MSATEITQVVTAGAAVTLRGLHKSYGQVRALRAAEITADLPHAVDNVAVEYQEPFAYVLREGVTNVIRHSGATQVQVRLGETWIEIHDNGLGSTVDNSRSGRGIPFARNHSRTDNRMIRVLLADDQALVRGALAAILGLEPDIEVVAEVSSGNEVLPAARRVNPDVALLDVQMPGRDGLPAAAEFHRELPSCRIVVCTTFGRPGYLARAMAAGVAGFVVKDAPPEQLVDAVRRVHNGLRVVDPALAAESLATGQKPLTERQRDVLRI